MTDPSEILFRGARFDLGLSRHMDFQDPAHISGPIKESKSVPMRERTKNWQDEDVNPQDDCLLFAILPGEIRERIWFWTFSPVVEHVTKDSVNHPMNYRSDHKPDLREDQNLLAYSPSAPPTPGLPPDEDPELNADQDGHCWQYTQGLAPQDWHTYDWLRPGYPGPKQIKGLPLLCTSRRIYLEAHLILPQAADHVFWCHRPAPGRKKMPDQFFRQLPPEQVARVRTVHLYTQMYFLEDNMHEILAVAGRDLSSQPLTSQELAELEGQPLRKDFVLNGGYMCGLTTLRLTIRRGDWWFNETNTELVINPFRNNDEGRSGMLVDMRRVLGNEKVNSWGPKYTVPAGYAVSTRKYDERGQAFFSAERAWGATFRFLPQLRTVIIDFETSEDKREELSHIVEWARTWRFPAAPLSQSLDTGASGGAPSTKQRFREFRVSDNYNSRDLSGLDVDSLWSWRGMTTQWSDRCTDQQCNAPLYGAINRECGWCCRRYRMRRRALGPRLYGWTLVWIAVAVDGDLYEGKIRTKQE